MALSQRLNGSSSSFSFDERPPPYMYSYNLDHEEDLAVSPPTWCPPPRRDLHLVDRPQSSRSFSGRHQRQDRAPFTGTATADPGMTAEEFEALPAAVRRKVRAASSSAVRSSVGTIRKVPGLHRQNGSCTSGCVTPSPGVRPVTAILNCLLLYFFYPPLLSIAGWWRSDWRLLPPILATDAVNMQVHPLSRHSTAVLQLTIFL